MAPTPARSKPSDANEPGPSVRPLRRWLHRFAAVLLGLALAELGLRFGLFVTGRSYAAEENALRRGMLATEVAGTLPLVGTNDPVGFVPDELNGDRFLHPYTGWESFLGFRRLDLELRDPPSGETYDIWIVGGSVAAIFGSKDVGGAPNLVQLLRGDPRFADRPPRVVNFAKGAYKQPQQLHLVAYLLELLPPPALVLNIDGFNEVAIGNQNASLGVHPIYPAPIQWSTLARTVLADVELFDDQVELRHLQLRTARFSALCDRLHVDSSAVLGFAARRWMLGLRSTYHHAHEEYADRLGQNADHLLRGPRFDSEADVLERCVRIWEDSSAMLHALLTRRGVDYLHVLQPTLHDAGSKPLTPEEIATSGAIPEWIDGARDGYPLLRAAGLRLAAQGIPFLDATAVFRDAAEPIYVDSCHFESRGNQLLARLIAEHLLREP